MIEFKCNQCGETMEAPQSLAGQTEKCPKCGALRRVPSQARSAAPAHKGKHLLIGAVIVGVIAAAGVGGYLAVRLGLPKQEKPASLVTAPDRKVKGINIDETEVARLRAENAQLKAEIAKPKAMQPPLPVRAAPTPRDPPLQFAPAVASPPVPKGVTVSGSAYVVRQSGQSDILRGLHVTLIQSTVPVEVWRKTLTTVVQNYKNEAAERHQTAVKEGKVLYLKPEETFVGEQAKEAESEAQEYSQILAKVCGPVDSATALKLLCTAGFRNLNVIRDLVDSIKIATTTTDVQGTYKFADAPASACIFALFETPQVFLVWAVPVHDGGSKDLYNDTALAAGM